MNAELRNINRQLHQIGEHICTDCQRRLARSEENFDRSESSGGYFSRCKRCRGARQNARQRQRYRQDAGFRQERLATSRAYYDANRERVLERTKRRSLEKALADS